MRRLVSSCFYLIMCICIKLANNTKSIMFQRNFGPRGSSTLKYTLFDGDVNNGTGSKGDYEHTEYATRPHARRYAMHAFRGLSSSKMDYKRRKYMDYDYEISPNHDVMQGNILVNLAPRPSDELFENLRGVAVTYSILGRDIYRKDDIYRRTGYHYNSIDQPHKGNFWRDIRRKRRQQRQRDRQIRRLRKHNIIPTQRPHHQQQYHHRHLYVDDNESPSENIGYDTYNDQNANSYVNHVIFRPRHPRRPDYIPRGRQLPTERQLSLAGLFATNPAGAGLAWFASLVGLAAMAREPLSTVFEGVSPWDRILNSTESIELCADSIDGFCPVDCEYHQWNEWSSCTVTCGGGIKLRSRLIKTHDAHGGLPCDGIQGGGSSLDGIQTGTEKTACNTQICPPVNCVWGAWDTWATCSKTCGGGVQVRTRKVDTHEENGGTACSGLSTEQQNCNTGTCPAINCVWGTWDTWATCSKTCGSGVQVRARKVATHEENGGTTCTGSSSEQQNCNTGSCPAVNCAWGTWDTWASCSKTCGGGLQVRTRKVDTHAENGGTACSGLSTEQQGCNSGTCPAVNCVWGSWDTWATCTVTCGGGVQVRTRKIDTHEENSGTACSGVSTEQQTCSTGSCPAVNCVWGSWSSWSSCAVTCGGSVQLRARLITTHSENGGTCSGDPVESQACATTLCAGGVISWSQTLPTGTVSYTSTYCTSMETFQASLVGKQTTSITLGAGGSSYSCTDATTAKQITDAFSTCTTTCTSQSFSCNGVNWWIGKCGPGGEIGIGTSICSCSGTISIRPCINNNNWGGLGSNTCGQSSQTLSVTVNYSA